MEKKKMKMIRRIIFLLISIVLILGLVDVLDLSQNGESEVPKSETELLTEERNEFLSIICERWKSTYPIIPANLSNNYKIRGDKNLVMEVGVDDWSREIVFLKKVSFLVSSPLEFELQSGDVLTIEPEKGLIDLSGEKIIKIRGKENKGCILFY